MSSILPVADYPFLEVFWTMILFFAWLAWIWIAISIFADIFRRHDIGGWHKAAWVVFIIVVPFLGVLVMDQYVRETAGGSAAEIARAKELLDAGTISQAEFDAIKAKALG
jgi:general stress protein CsbA